MRRCVSSEFCASCGVLVRLTAAGVVTMLLMGCVVDGDSSNPWSAAPEQEILVTFNLPKHENVLHSGSQRSYRSGSVWDADLHTRAQVRRLANDYNLQFRAGWPVAALNLYCVAYRVADDVDLPRLMQSLGGERSVHRVQRNQHFRGMTKVSTARRDSANYNDPLFALQYGEHAQALLQLHQHSRGQNVRVGIIDSNVDDKHPDLAGQILEQHSFARGFAADTSAHLLHGTAVAGVIAAAGDNRTGVVGMAPEAQVHVFGACREAAASTMCDSFALAQALQSAIDKRVHILNMSLAGPADPLLGDLLGVAHKHGMIVVAADNSAAPEANFPASMPGVFAVGADTGYWFARTEHLSTQAGGGYQVFRGTSVAAAGFTGMAALLRARHSQAVTHTSLTHYSEGCRKASGPEQVPKQVYDVAACL